MATTTPQTYNVGGVMLQQPFKIRRLGHFGFNVSDMEKAVHFYRDLLGFRVSDVLDFKQLPHMREDLQHVEDGRATSSTAATTITPSCCSLSR